MNEPSTSLPESKSLAATCQHIQNVISTSNQLVFDQHSSTIQTTTLTTIWSKDKVPSCSKMEEVKVNKQNMTLEEFEEYNRQFIRKLRENPEYRQMEKAYREKYYQENRAKILSKGREKVTCTCGCVLSKCSLSKHKKSQQHINSTN